jgi:hypothetical protein
MAVCALPARKLPITKVKNIALRKSNGLINFFAESTVI